MPHDQADEEAAPFHTSIAHLYRGEMQRITVWRARLDSTTQWAIILTTALTTFVLGSASAPHFIMLLGSTPRCVDRSMTAPRPE